MSSSDIRLGFLDGLFRLSHGRLLSLNLGLSCSQLRTGCLDPIGILICSRSSYCPLLCKARVPFVFLLVELHIRKVGEPLSFQRLERRPGICHLRSSSSSSGGDTTDFCLLFFRSHLDNRFPRRDFIPCSNKNLAYLTLDLWLESHTLARL